MSIASQLSFSTATSLVGGATGSIPYQSLNSTTVFIPIGSANQILISNGTTATWATTGSLTAGVATTATSLAGGTAGQVPYQTGAGATSFFGPGTAGNVLVSNGTSAPSYNNTLTLSGTTAATSTATGALVVSGGGLGVNGSAYIGGNAFVIGDLEVRGGDLIVNGTTTFNLADTTATTVNFARAATALTMGATSGSTTVRNNLVVTGNLTVNGSTVIVDSTVTNVSDPIFIIGSAANGADPSTDDNKDRGIQFKWHNGTSAKNGFFGYDDSTGFFTFVPDATISNEVVSGTKGALDAYLAGGAAMSVVYQSAANTTAFLAAGTAGQVLQTNGTGSAPSWTATSGIIAGTATQMQTTRQTTNATYYPTFVDSDNASATAETFYTTSTFSINPNTGFVGVGSQDGSSPLNVKVLSTLSGTINSFQKVLTTQAAGGNSNNVYRTEWRRRRSAGTDWTTQNIHDGIWVDSSFTTPGTDTRTWWDRDPNTPSQAWGDQATTWIFANSTGVHLGGGTNPQKTLQLAGTTPTIRLEENGGGAKRLELSVNSSGEGRIAAPQSAQVLLFDTIGTERLRLDASGNAILAFSSSVQSGGVSGTATLYTPAMVLGGQTSSGDSLYARRWATLLYQFQTYGSAGNTGTIALQPYGGGLIVGGSGSTTTNKFEVSGSVGQLFSVADSFTGTIFAASDVSGIPSIEVLDTGLVKLAQYNGSVAISTGTIQQAMGLTVNTASYILSLGVGTTASGTVGEIRATNEITAYYTSDIRFKENITAIPDPITMIDQIRGVYFDWKDDYIAARGGEDGFFVRKHDVGVIAQEIEAVLPEIVATRDDGSKAVKYEKLVPLLIEAIKSQQADIDLLKSEIQKIKKHIK